MQNPPFVKKFDFRGVYNKDIVDADAFYLAHAFIKTLLLKKVLIGWDTRASSKTLAFNFIQALKDTDIEICFLDTVPIDYVTASAYTFDFDLSVMFTASHNPWDWTGMLIHTQKGESLQGEIVETIIKNYYELKSIEYSAPSFELSQFTDFLATIEEVYTKKIQSLLPLHEIKNLQVAVDIGDGSGSKSLSILEKILPQVTFIRINDRGTYDANTPHQADPSELKNMHQVIEAVKNERYDCGFAFDSDGDRVLAVDEKGTYLNGSILASGLIECFLMLGFSSHTIGYAVECGPALYNAVTDLQKTSDHTINIQPIVVGRSLVRKMVQDGEIEMGVENVGHFYVKDFFMTDSGIFSLAVILYWISMNGELSKLSKKNPDGRRSHGSIPLDTKNEEMIAQIATNITEHFESKEIKKIEVDGQRCEIFDGERMESWYAMRKSGYEAKEKFYFGSLNDDDFAFLDEQFQKV